MEKNARRWWNSAFSLALLIVAGCGPTSDLRGVQGTVTFENQPVESGTIEFTPLTGTKGALAGAAIQNGKYSVPQDRGVRAAGKYKVSIISMKKTGKTVPGFSDKAGKPLDEFANFLPAEYNSRTKIDVKISDKWQNTIDFHLEKDGSWNVESSGEARK